MNTNRIATLSVTPMSKDIAELKPILVHILDGHGGATVLSTPPPQPPQPGEGVHWIHLDYTDPEQREWLNHSSNLNPLVVQALLAEETRPRATPIGEGLFLALRGVNHNVGAEPDDMVSIRIWIEPNRIISSRKRSLVSVTDLRSRLQEGCGPKSVGDFLVQLTDRLVWRMTDTVDNFEDRVADLEEAVIEENSLNMRYELATLRRQAISIRRYLAPQREALAQLLVERPPWFNDEQRMRLREVCDRLIRHIEDLDEVRERAAVTHEELLSRLSENLNKRMYVLSIITAVFLPLGFLTGLFGINVGGLPGANSTIAFWVFSFTLLILVTIQIVVFRVMKWL